MVDLLGEACKVEKEEKLEPSSATNMNNMDMNNMNMNKMANMNKDMMPTHKNKALSTGKDQLIVDPTPSV